MSYNIKNILAESPLILAPMAGLTDLAFREICREQSTQPLLGFTEMVSAKALHYKDKKTFELLKTSKLDTPLSVQLFGSQVDIMAEGARMIEDLGFSMIDFNCGCPAPKIVKNGEGSALMQNPKLIFDIVSAMRKATKLPLSVKMRIGYDWDHANVLEVAKLCEDAGCDFVTIHARTRDMFYSGQADYRYIKKVKEALSIPVIGNGDVVDFESYQKMKAETNCDAVMIGRASLGNPFIFEKIKHSNKIVTKFEKMEILLKQVEKMCEYKENGIKEARTHILWYLKNLVGAKKYKVMAGKVLKHSDVKNLVEEILSDEKI
jgi:nifR3 family TIM-barrel protein